MFYPILITFCVLLIIFIILMLYAGGMIYEMVSYDNSLVRLEDEDDIKRNIYKKLEPNNVPLKLLFLGNNRRETKEVHINAMPFLNKLSIDGKIFNIEADLPQLLTLFLGARKVVSF